MLKKYCSVPIIFVVLFFCWGIANPLYAQENPKQYTVFNRALTISNGVIHLNNANDDGIAWINGKSFTNGTIEFDIKGEDKPQGSFVGFAFHGVNDSTFEAIYFRPFNFRSADPVRKGHSVQYVASPTYDWSKLRSEFPNKYEQPVSPVPDPNGWFHVRITVQGKKINVYVNDNEQPSLTVVSLVKTEGKMLGYWVGNTSMGSWKNLRVEIRD